MQSALLSHRSKSTTHRITAPSTPKRIRRVCGRLCDSRRLPPFGQPMHGRPSGSASGHEREDAGEVDSRLCGRELLPHRLVTVPNTDGAPCFSTAPTYSFRSLDISELANPAA